MGYYDGQNGATIHIEMVAKVKGMSLKRLGDLHGDTKRNVFYNKLHRDTMKFKEVEEIADILDCDVVLRDRKTGAIY